MTEIPHFVRDQFGLASCFQQLAASLRLLRPFRRKGRLKESLLVLTPLASGLRRPIGLLAMTVLLAPPLFAFDLEGKVKVEPPYPEPHLLQVAEKDVADCGQEKISSRLKIAPDGGVAHAVVKLGAPLPKGAWPLLHSKEKDFVLDQIDCEFAPHVLLLPQGATLSILNSDGFLHNVRAFDEKTDMLFNDAMPKKGQVLKKRFKAPGRFILRCGLHHWMHAIVVVQEHPFYAVTDEKGHFKISGIPEGSYKLSIWHEELGEIEAEVNPTTGFLLLTYPPLTEST